MPEPPIVVHQNGGVVATGGKVAGDLIGGLSSTPVLLLIVVLNIAAMAVAGWYLTSQETLRAQSFDRLLNIISVCVAGFAPQAVQGGIGHQ